MSGEQDTSTTLHSYGEGEMVVRAAGMMVFRLARGCVISDQPKVEYLMMRASYGKRHWTPPKGHVDPGEDLLTTAVRETREESGLIADTHYIVAPDFKVETKYQVKSHLDGVVRPKVVTYFLAKLTDPGAEVVLSEEHTDYKWLSMDKSLQIGGFDNMTDIFRQCQDKALSM